jgi:23S rRNA (uracil1939-C5)-methyltransferase
VTSEIVRIASRGEGVSTDGTFHPLTAPGDLVHADGRIEPGPHHALPSCRHYPLCGGCQLQHLDDDAYRTFIVDRISSALAVQGVTASSIRAPHLSPPLARRRVSLTAERKGKAVLLGFNERASHRLVDIHQCAILRPELFGLVRPLRTLLAQILPARARGSVQMSLADQGVDVLIKGVTIDGLEAAEAVTGFAVAHGLARLSVDEGLGASPRWEPAPVTVTLGGTPVPFPEGAFLQATEDGEAALVSAVRAALGSAARIADLFAGLGTFALSLDQAVHAVEGARDAALALIEASRRAGAGLSVEHRDLYRRPLTVSEIGAFDAVILDPPRAGAQEQVVQIAGAAVPHIAYVSCNPSTFARDARILVEGGYRLDWIQPVGQFRWSTHVELAAAFSHQPV